ncbi:hypothetical protein [Aeromicrobium sp. Leaf272]|nr:hypothetical protein [Aeromicrobium sp. Leaf272]
MTDLPWDDLWERPQASSIALPGSHHPADLQGAALLFEAGADPRRVTA